MPAERPLRADAARNRAKILEAANRQVIARGPEVPMEAIAEEAGVAVGTLYRHFPTKQDLVVAVVADHLDEMAAGAEAVADRIDAGANAFEEFAAFARVVAENAASNLAVKAAARTLGADPHDPALIARGAAAMERILAAGRAEGSLRADLTPDDGYLFISTFPADQPRAVRDRWFEIMMDGFRAGAERP